MPGSTRSQIAYTASTLASVALLTAAPPPARGAPGDTELVSVHLYTGEAAGDSALRGPDTVSSDGRYVAFMSRKYSIAAGDSNRLPDIFVRDRWLGVTRRVSVASDGSQSDGQSDAPALSANGRYVVFQSQGMNLAPPGPGQLYTDQIYLHDRSTGRTEFISVAADGGSPDGGSYEPAVSAEGRYVAFLSTATNVVAGHVGSLRSVYLRDRLLSRTVLVSAGWAYSVAISADGRYVAFHTDTRIPNDRNGSPDVLVWDRLGGETEIISVDPAGYAGIYGGTSPAISPDGRFVAFTSRSPNLVADDSNGTEDVFLRDRLLRTTTRISLAANGDELAQGGEGGQFGPSMSADGRFITFTSGDPYVVEGDTNGAPDVFVRDTQKQRTVRVSISSSGRQGYSVVAPTPAISGDGQYVAFDTYSSGLVPNDTNYAQDVFVHELGIPTQVPPAFTLKPTAVDFGTRPVGSSTEHRLWLQNTGESSLSVTRLRIRGEVPAMYRASHRCGKTVGPGTGCQIRVTYAPTSVGLHSARLVVVVDGDIRRSRALSGEGAPP